MPTMTPDRALLAAMAAEKGYRERMTGWTKFGQWYEDETGAPGFAVAPWCQMSISWAAARAGIPQAVIPRMAYTPYAAQWFADRGQWGRTPRAGALVFYDWDGTRNISAIDHVGLVRAVLPDGRIDTLEGNTSNQLLERRRSLSGVAGFGYPDYAAVHTPTWTEKIVDELPLLTKGCEKDAKLRPHIKTVYGLLYSRGYPVPPGVDDTTYGDPMVDRVKALQKAKKLVVDGEVGPKTWPKLILP